MAWNGSDNKVKVGGQQKKPPLHSTPTPITYTYKRGALAPLLGHRFATRLRLGGYGLAVVALGCAALYYFTRQNQLPTDQPTNQPTTPTAIAEVAPSISAREALIAEAKKHPRAKREKRTIEIVPGKPAVEVPDVVQQTPEMTEAERKARKRPWSNTTEQLLVQLLSCPVGLPPRPISPLPHEELDKMLEILAFKSAAEEDDDEGDAWAKELINEGKRLMVDFIADGGDPYDFVSHYYNELDKACEMRNMATAEVQRIIEEDGDADLAAEFQKTVNEKLSQEGIVPIDVDIDFEREEMEAKKQKEQEETK